MSALAQRRWMGVFDNEENILAVTGESRRRGFEIVDVYTPYAVHGLDDAMGQRRSWLPWVCFVCGAIGGFGMLWLGTWTLAVDWPSNIGGKPYNSFPAIVPIIFELIVLFGGYGSIFALLLYRRLLPGMRAKIPHPRVTDDRFAIVLRMGDGSKTFDAARLLFEEFGAVEIQDCHEEVTA